MDLFFIFQRFLLDDESIFLTVDYLLMFQITTLNSKRYPEFTSKIMARFGDVNGDSSPSKYLSSFIAEEEQESKSECHPTFDENIYCESDALAYPETVR